MNRQQVFGRRAEEIAAGHLVSRHWQIVGRNVRVGRGELDIIARRGSTLAFVEVKARHGEAFGAPEEAVHWRKRRQITRLAALWLAQRPRALAGIDDVRFDVIAVDAGFTPPRVRHLPAAFSAQG